MEDFKRYLKNYVESITKKSKYGGYICPACGSGTGHNKTGAFHLYDNDTKFKCHSCGIAGDIIDLCQTVEHTDQNGAFESIRSRYGIERQQEPGSRPATVKPQDNTNHETKPAADKEKTDYTAYFLQASKRINETDYLQRRGIGPETAKRFLLGYDPEWKSPTVLKKGKNPPPTPRLIIPTSRTSYLARDTRAEISEDQQQYSKMKEGKVSIFNIKALAAAERPIFITEGEIDAMSIVEAGGEAIGTGSTSNINKLVEMAVQQPPKQYFIICMDNDDAGAKAEKELAAAFQEKSIPYTIGKITGSEKDANAALVKNREAFIKVVQSTEKRKPGEPADEEKNLYLQESAGACVDSFMQGIQDLAKHNFTPTGFEGLDNLINGGLFAGLYIIGAISSLGKTTLALQIADNIAAAGTDVLYFSLEMSKAELMSKSISRFTYGLCKQQSQDIKKLAKPAWKITTGRLYNKYSYEEMQIINQAAAQYKQQAGRLFITESIGDVGPDDIRAAVNKHILFTGRKPVVFIDYLQILKPDSDRGTDKQNTDRAVFKLKQTSRDYDIPVFAISSFNRDNYNTPVTMSSFKESGAIEYSSDVLMGLQPAGMVNSSKADDVKRNIETVEACKRAEKRNVELKILKQRNGRTGQVVEFEYTPAYNVFEEPGKNFNPITEAEKTPFDDSEQLELPF